jgi:hypothetical protein
MAEESTEATEREDEQESSSGADSEEGKAEQREERDAPAGEGEGDDSGGGDDDEPSASEKAQQKEEESEQAREKIKELEEGDPPEDLEDWPDDAAKYETFGGPEGEHGYHEGPEEEKLGPSSLRHKEDGGVTIAGDEVDDPDEYKSDPIPGGPTDPDAKQDLTQKKIRESQGRDIEDSSQSDSDDSDDDGDSGDSDDGEDSSSEEKEDSN